MLRDADMEGGGSGNTETSAVPGNARAGKSSVRKCRLAGGRHHHFHPERSRGTSLLGIIGTATNGGSLGYFPVLTGIIEGAFHHRGTFAFGTSNRPGE